MEVETEIKIVVKEWVEWKNCKIETRFAKKAVKEMEYVLQLVRTLCTVVCYKKRKVYADVKDKCFALLVKTIFEKNESLIEQKKNENCYIKIKGNWRNEIFGEKRDLTLIWQIYIQETKR